jgi:hypothetical protein
LDRQQRDELVVINVLKALDTLHQRGDIALISTVGRVIGYSADILTRATPIQTYLAMSA